MAVKRKEAKKGMAIKTISISESLWEEMLNLARRQEKPASMIIRDLIKGYVARAKRKEEKQSWRP